MDENCGLRRVPWKTKKNEYNFLIGKPYTTGFSEQQLKR